MDIGDIKIPVWEEDPYYKKTQDVLFPFGSGLLEGNVPDYYKTIGQVGSPEFENMLRLTQTDTANAVNNNLIRRNIGRGGLGASIAAKANADTGTRLRWSDFQRAIQGKEFLLNIGKDTLTGVRSSALNITGMKNNFNQQNFQNEFGLFKYEDTVKREEEASESAMWQNLLKAGISAAAIIASGGLAAPAVAGAGAAGATGLGSAAAIGTGAASATAEMGNLGWQLAFLG